LNLRAIVIIIFLVLLLPVSGFAVELKTRLSRLEFSDPELLSQFNRNIRLGLSNSLGRLRRQIALEDEVSNKVDLVYGRVQEILDMHTRRNDLTIVLLPSEAEVLLAYQQQYTRHADYIAYYSPETNSIYFAVDKVNVRVLAHELAHVVIHHFFQKRPPERVHELLAQHVERQFKSTTQKSLK
jgi:hypothetical protein